MILYSDSNWFCVISWLSVSSLFNFTLLKFKLGFIIISDSGLMIIFSSLNCFGVIISVRCLIKSHLHSNWICVIYQPLVKQEAQMGLISFIWVFCHGQNSFSGYSNIVIFMF